MTRITALLLALTFAFSPLMDGDMARGRFGRRRTNGSASLSALIISLMKEQRSAEDRAIFDAYQNGGLFKGEKVTDQRILSYIKSRRDGFSKDDPLYDEWNNRLIQQDFAIGEQKIGLAFKQGRVGAGAVAAFYNGQLKKIPKDSAFYREVAGRAADWAKSAAAAARGAARSRANKLLAAKEKVIFDKFSEHAALEAALTEAAQRAGLIAGNMTLTDADATDLKRLLDSGAVTFGGRPVTLSMWQQSAISTYGQFDKLIALRKQAGRAVKELTDQKNKWLTDYVVRVNAVDDRAAYEMARDNWLEAISNANGNPFAIIEANKKYAATLGGIRDSALSKKGSSENDPEFIGGLANEINAVLNGKANGPTVSDLQSNTGEGVVTGDAEGIANSTLALTQDAQKFATGQAYYGQDAYGGSMKVVDYPPGGAMDPTGRHGLDPSFQVSISLVNGSPQTVVLKGQTVSAVTYTDGSGRPVDTTGLSPQEINAKIASGEWTKEADQTIGYVFSNTLSGKTSYGVVQPDGSVAFTDKNPFDGLMPGGKDGFFVATSQVTTDSSGKPVFQFGAGLVQGAGSGVPGTISFDPVMADSTVASSDIAKFASGPAIDAYIQKRNDEAAAKDFSAQLKDQASAPMVASPALTQAFGNALGSSPVGNLVMNAGNVVADLLRKATLPGAGVSPGARPRDLGAPPPIPNSSPTPPSPTMPPPPKPPSGTFTYTPTPDPHPQSYYDDLNKKVDWSKIADAYKPPTSGSGSGGGLGGKIPV